MDIHYSENGTIFHSDTVWSKVPKAGEVVTIMKVSPNNPNVCIPKKYKVLCVNYYPEWVMVRVESVDKPKLNRLKGSRTYLSGAMDRVTSEQSEQWRNALKPWLRGKGVVIVDPCNKPVCTLGNSPDESDENRAKANIMKKEGDFEGFRDHYRPIRNTDLRFCDIVDFLIVNLDLEQHPCGTYNEIFIAVQQKKPVIIHCIQGKHQIPSWLFGAIPHQLMFSTWDEVKEYLRHVDEDEVVDDLGRWYLFDFDKTVWPDETIQKPCPVCRDYGGYYSEDNGQWVTCYCSSRKD